MVRLGVLPRVLTHRGSDVPDVTICTICYPSLSHFHQMEDREPAPDLRVAILSLVTHHYEHHHVTLNSEQIGWCGMRFNMPCLFFLYLGPLIEKLNIK